MTDLQLGQVSCNNLRCADDTALIADSEQKLRELLNKVILDSERLGLTINCQKTFSMVCTKKEQSPKCQVYVNGTQIEQKDSFTYLGSLVTSDGRSNKDIQCRVAMAKKAFMEFRNVLCDRSMNLEVKRRLLKCHIWSVLTNGCESWTISKVMEGKLVAAEMWFYRRMLRVSWKEMVTNEEILNRMRTKRLLVDTIRGRQWKLIGHVLREEDEIERHIIETRMEGERAR